MAGKFCIIVRRVNWDDRDVPHFRWGDPECFRTARQAKAALRREERRQFEEAEWGDPPRDVKFCTRSSPRAALRCKVTPLRKRGPVKAPRRRTQRRDVLRAEAKRLAERFDLPF